MVDSIAEVGFARTTAAEITRRAGVTWGAVQHHFGDKDGILLAVLEDSFRRFAERLAAVPLDGVSIERRVRLFLESAWDHFTSREYASTYEILLDHLRRSDLPGPGWREQMSLAWDREWRRFFDLAAIPRRRHGELQHYTLSVLSGLASMRLLEGRDARARDAELALLARTLVRELAPAG